jgi:hypothetical protein
VQVQIATACTDIYDPQQACGSFRQQTIQSREEYRRRSTEAVQARDIREILGEIGGRDLFTRAI